MLTAKDKYAIEQTGEITREIEFNDPARHCLLRGKLRILKTENSQTFNFVEVGEWVYHGHRSYSGQLDTHEFRDSLLYDEHGNTLARRIYEKQGEQFQIKEQWSSELIEGRFLQHMKVYEKGALVAEYTRNVLNYLEPKSDLQKDKIPFGTDKGYHHDGTLAYVRNYNDDGKLIAEKKYGTDRSATSYD